MQHQTRRICRCLCSVQSYVHTGFSPSFGSGMQASSRPYLPSKPIIHGLQSFSLRSFTSSLMALKNEATQGPSPPASSSLLGEQEYHDLANQLLDCLQENIDILGEDLEIEGFDIDHAEGVLTVRLGSLGTYVINKQTPNRQIWVSSPVSGPSRFDWDEKAHSWVYRRTSSELISLLQKELSDLLNTSVCLR